jgi:Chitobiase/beta-hexosaminidase C-terminal domain/Fn3 associated
MKLQSIHTKAIAIISTILLGILVFSTASSSGQTSTDIQVTNSVQQSTVHRLGVNLGDQNYWDSGQMMKNLIFENPGFEGLKYRSIFHCAIVTANTCQDDNQYNGQTAGFWNGGSYRVLSGNAAGTLGTIVSNTAPGTCSGCGPTFTFDQSLNLAVGDYFSVLTSIPGSGDAAWGDDVSGGGTITTETTDLSPETPGKQAMLLSASGSGQSAALLEGFDTWSGLSFIQLNGVYEVTFRAKGVGGTNVLNVGLRRLEAGLNAYLSTNVTLTNTWQDYTLTFTANETGSAVGPVQLAFTAKGSNVELDDVSVDQTNSSSSNPTVFRDDVVNALKELNPGTLRMMAAGAALGSDLPNQLQVPFARYREGFNADGNTYPDIAYGIHEFLQLCQTIDADPWITIPTATTPEEMADFIQYLTGTGSDSWSALRISRGQTAPWTSVFNKIHIEFGNETWNGYFKGESMNYPGYPLWANQIFGAARSTSGFDPNKFDLVLSGLAASPGYNQPMLTYSTQHDSFDIAPYLLFNANNESQTLMFGALFAEPELFDSAGGEVYKNLQVGAEMPSATAKTTNVSVYETNLGTMGGNITQAQLNTLTPSIGAGIAHTEHMMQMMRAGIQYQNTFALPQYEYRRSDASMVPMWGIVVDMGTTGRRRPQFLTQAMANAVIGGTMMQTVHTGTNPTWNQPLSSDSVVLNGAHELQSFAFVNNGQASTVVFNLSQTTALPVTFSGANAPSGSVEMTQITSANITDNNETSQVVTPTTQTLSSFNPATGLTLPPFSMTVLTGISGAVPPPTFSVAGGTYTAAQQVTLTDATPNATIYCTTDGSTPTTSSPIYSGAITISNSIIIQAIAVVAGVTPSPVSSASYVIVAPTVATPTLGLAAGSYAGTQTLTITDGTSGATIYYTTNGATPTAASAKYTGAITISTSETVKAFATAAGDTDSAVASAAYTINASAAAAPKLSLAAGSFTTAQTLTITDATSGAAIYYTTNGTTPTTGSTKYTGAISVTATETVKAIAIVAGYSQSAVTSAEFTILVPAVPPAFSVKPGTYSTSQTVALSSTTSGSTIYYTTNGVVPTTASTKYSSAIAVNNSATIMAMATAPSHLASPAITGIFNIVHTQIAVTPAFSLAAGTYGGVQKLTITDTTAGAVIYYTTNGATPTTASTRYAGPITLSTNQTVKAIATATNYTSSAVASAAYVINALAAGTPKFSLAAGSYTSTQTLSISDATAGATIYYTTTGVAPTTSSTKYTGAISISASETVKAIATATGNSQSAMTSAAYTILTPAVAPVFSLKSGTYSGEQAVALSSTTTGAIIYYTTNGATPTASSTRYTAPIAVNNSSTIRAIATASGHSASTVVTGVFDIVRLPTVLTPSYSLAAGSYSTAQTLKIIDVTPGSTIYYTTNGATPTTASTRYTVPITISVSQTVRAMAMATNFTPSAVAAASYTISAPVAALPKFSLAAGTYSGAQTLTFTDSTSGASIYYTTNGTTPTTGSTKYTAAIKISVSETVKAIAAATNYNPSATVSAAYTITTPVAATPKLSLAAGTYSSAQTLTIADSTSGASIYYTTNGATPSASSTKYSAAIKVSATETVKAIAVATGYTTSAAASAAYTITAPTTATPALSMAAGIYAGAQTLTISDSTSGAVIYYTVNGVTPTSASTKYTAAIKIAATETVKAIAIAGSDKPSGVVSAAYTITAPDTAVPKFSLAAGSYFGWQTITMADATPGAAIYYTVGGVAPNANTTKYTGPIQIKATETVKAMAVAPNYLGSATLTAVYTITEPTVATPTLSLAAGTYIGTKTVTLSDTTSGATIRYTTSGAAPTTASPIYTGAITVSATETVMAIAIATYYNPSAVTSAHYTIMEPTAATPALSLAAGSYTGARTITISDATSGATIYYTTNGATPTTGSTKYTGAITVSASETVKAIASVANYYPSAVASAAYTIVLPAAAAPKFSVAAGSYTATQTVTITDATAGSTISYSINGGPWAKYTAALKISGNSTIEATAIATNFSTSATATAAYKITPTAVAAPIER